jgi:small subunit ribosomal protein S4
MLKGNRCQTAKCTMERRRRVMTGRGRRRRLSDRGVQLVEKQKARFTYGVMERQFRRFFADAERQPGVTGDNLKVMLEKRLDNVVYRLGFADSRAQARQLVLHGHITLNGRRASVPSRLVKESDIIAVKEASTRTEYFKRIAEEIKAKTVPPWLSIDRVKLAAQVVAQPILDEASFKFDAKSIVEYYSR